MIWQYFYTICTEIRPINIDVWKTNGQESCFRKSKFFSDKLSAGTLHHFSPNVKKRGGLIFFFM
jgi:hypothetical protein